MGSASEEVGCGAASPVSALKGDPCDDLWTFGSGEEGDDDSGEDIDLEELGRALSEAASLASHSKKQMNNQDAKTSVKHLPLGLETRVIAIDKPGIELLWRKSRFFKVCWEFQHSFKKSLVMVKFQRTQCMC